MTTSQTTVPQRRVADYQIPRVFLWILCLGAVSALITTIHHLHGARIYETPARYHAVWLAVAGLVLQLVILAASRHLGMQGSRVARGAFLVTSVLFFVVLFGLIEGLVTHVAAPLVNGYSDSEPFDALFEVTGVLQILPAMVIAELMFAYLRGAGRRQ